MTRVSIGIPLAAVTIVVGVSAAVGGVADAPDGGCTLRNSKVLAIDRLGRVYSVREPDVGRVWLGCINARSHRRVFLRATNERTDLSKPRLATPFAALVEGDVSQLGNSQEVVLFDIRSGRDSRAATDDTAEVTDLTVTRRGAAVFITASSTEGPGRVRLLTRTDDRALDAGAITPGSLAVNRSGTRAYWLKDGMPMTATLP